MMAPEVDGQFFCAALLTLLQGTVTPYKPSWLQCCQQWKVCVLLSLQCLKVGR